MRDNMYTPGGYTWKKGLSVFCSASHVLVAGSTGSGKSVFLNDCIYSLLANSKSTDIELYLIDPKRVELNQYKNLPHVKGFATERDDIIFLLDTVLRLMENRYKAMEQLGMKKFENARVYVIVDELADLMTTMKKDVFYRLQRIAQLGRAANICLVVATQAPSRKIIPAELTLNFTHKICLHCDTAIESRQVLNQPGGEELPRYGECIMRSPDGLERFGIPYITDDQITERVTAWMNEFPVEPPKQKKRLSLWQRIAS